MTTPIAGLNASFFDMTAKSNGERYRIFVAESGVDNGRPLPVIYVLDGNYRFGTVIETSRSLWLEAYIPNALVVGIGCASYDPGLITKRRNIDYVPDITSDIRNGADLFLDFIEHELNPLFQKSTELSVDANDCTIIGHSFGGLFATWALLTRPEVFNRYVSISPSLFRIKSHFDYLIDNFNLRGSERHYYSTAGELEHPHHKAKLLERMVRDHHPWVGLLEEEIAMHARAGIEGPIDIPKDLLEFDALLASKHSPLLRKHCEVLANESHNTIVAGALSQGLRHVFDSTEGAVGTVTR